MPRLRCALALGLLAVVVSGCRSASAVELRVEEPIARLSPSGVGAIYLRVVNSGSLEDLLLGASSPVAAELSLHETIEEEGVTKMLHRPEGFRVPARGALSLTPGGRHLMLFGLTEPASKRAQIAVVLRFLRSGERRIEVRVESSER